MTELKDKVLNVIGNSIEIDHQLNADYMEYYRITTTGGTLAKEDVNELLGKGVVVSGVSDTGDSTIIWFREFEQETVVTERTVTEEKDVIRIP